MPIYLNRAIIIVLTVLMVPLCPYVCYITSHRRNMCLAFSFSLPSVGSWHLVVVCKMQNMHEGKGCFIQRSYILHSPHIYLKKLWSTLWPLSSSADTNSLTVSELQMTLQSEVTWFKMTPYASTPSCDSILNCRWSTELCTVYVSFTRCS